MLFVSCLPPSPFNHALWNLFHYKQSPYILTISTQVFPSFSVSEDRSLPWDSCFPWILLKGKGLLLTYTPLLRLEVGINVSFALQSCCQTSLIKLSLTLRLTSHPYVIPVVCQPVDQCVYSWKILAGGSWPLSPQNSANCQPGWVQNLGNDPRDPLAPLILTFKPIVFTLPCWTFNSIALWCHHPGLSHLKF